MSMGEYAALPPHPPLLSYHIISIESQLLFGTAGRKGGGTAHLLPVSTWCYIGFEDSFSSICCLAQPPCHRWTLAQELLIKEHVRTAPSCPPCESRHLQPSHTLLDKAVLIKVSLDRTKGSVQNRITSTKKGVCLKQRCQGRSVFPTLIFPR